MRTRDDLYDALDRLPRPVTLVSLTQLVTVDPVTGKERPLDYVHVNTPQESAMLVEYFNGLPANEKHP